MAEVAVVGLPDPQWGERSHAMLALKKAAAVSEADFITFMHQFVSQGRITKWMIPSSIVFVESLPKTSVGKINKKVIRNMMS